MKQKAESRYRDLAAGALRKATIGVLWGAAVALLAGCANTVTTKVTNFHQWPANTAGATYAVQPSSSSVAAADAVALSELERKAYQTQLAQQLQAQGLAPAVTAAQARILADMQVRMQQHQVQITRPVYRPVPYAFGGWPWWHHRYYFDDGPLAGPFPMMLTEETVVQPVQTWQLLVRLQDRAQAAKSQPAPVVFESTAQYTGAPAPLNAVMPYLMRSVFDAFPGANGQTRLLPFDAETGARLADKPAH